MIWQQFWETERYVQYTAVGALRYLQDTASGTLQRHGSSSSDRTLEVE